MLTPHDIENKIFKVSIKGYNVGQVDDFLQEVCDSYIELYAENKKNKEDIERLLGAVDKYKSMEGTIRDALSVADRKTDKIERDADIRAKEIIRSAERTAESIIAGAEQKIAEEAHRLESIKRETELYKSKIVELLNAQLKLIDGYPEHTGESARNDKPKDAAAKWYENIGAVASTKRYTEDFEDNVPKFELDDSETKRVGEPVEFATERLAVVPTEKATSVLPRICMNENGEYVRAD